MTSQPSSSNSPLLPTTPATGLDLSIPESQVTKVLHCSRSSVPLATINLCIVEGYGPFLERFHEAAILHPFYGLHQTVLMKKLEDALTQAHMLEWELSPHQQQRLQLLVSALMWNLDSIKQDRPGLPSFQIAVGSAQRLLQLSKWFWHVSSQRLTFPLYSVSARNSNLEWENFRYWLDSAFEVREQWAHKSKELRREAELKQTQETLEALKKHQIYRRLDLRKVWRWIFLQCEGKITAGRLKTWEPLFLEGDLQAHEWLAEDVHDLQNAIIDCCDLGNEIMYFIRERLTSILTLIRDYYGSFTLVGSSSKDAFGESSHGPTAQEVEFLSSFDSKAEALEVLPTEPQRRDFATTALFLKAQASWNITKRRWELAQKRAQEQSSQQSSQESNQTPDSSTPDQL